MEKQYKYQLAIACLFKNSEIYLREFVAYHLLVGVEHFYLGNNRSTDGYREILEPYIQQGIVELVDVDKDFRSSFECEIHIPFYNSLINRLRGVVKWLACIDSDEFIVPVKTDYILDALAPYDNVGGIMVNWAMYGSSGVEKNDPNKLLVESLIKRAEIDNGECRNLKTILRPDRVRCMASAHHAHYYPPYHHQQTNGNIPHGELATPVVDELRINHYFIGSIEYYDKVKMPFYIRYIGGPTNPGRLYLEGRSRNDIFNKVEDRIMDRFIPRLKEKLFPNKD